MAGKPYCLALYGNSVRTSALDHTLSSTPAYFTELNQYLCVTVFLLQRLCVT